MKNREMTPMEKAIKDRLETGFKNWNGGYDCWLVWCNKTNRSVRLQKKDEALCFILLSFYNIECYYFIGSSIPTFLSVRSNASM